ncbi:SymE family type I addiction module toxin, partial [Xanthomonas campestris pv. raphani]|uniref:SymE family type I addiction module toxin n=1 Tax=Xanthomonas campestris TaxID=339 RepID=UPI002B2285F2
PNIWQTPISSTPDSKLGRYSGRGDVVRLRGLWLEQLGFAIGCKLQITARNGELVVTVAEDSIR